MASEPNGDSDLSVYQLYYRFSCAAGMTDDSQGFQLGLYLLYQTLFSTKITTNYTAAKRACSCVSLAKRMLEKDLSWSSYLERITTLRKQDFYECMKEIAQKYSDLLNKVKVWTEDLQIQNSRLPTLVWKFSDARHQKVARYNPKNK